MKSTVDYIGAVQGSRCASMQRNVRSVPFLCRTSTPTRSLSCGNLKSRGEWLLSSFLYIPGEIYYVPFDVIAGFWKRMEDGGRKSFTYEEAAAKAWKIRSCGICWSITWRSSSLDLDRKEALEQGGTHKTKEELQFMDFIISLVVILIFVAVSMKKAGSWMRS